MNTQRKSTISHKISIYAALFLLPNISVAGFPSGPYVAWVNLHEDTKPKMTKIIREFLSTQKNKNLCEDIYSGWIIYIQKRPTGISQELVSKTFNQRDQASKRILIGAIKNYRDEPDVHDGLDGTIAYTEAGAPHMASIDAHGKIKISKTIKDTNNSEQITDAFCSVMPEIYRK